MSLTLANAITQIRSILNETYEGFTELMPNQEDRDFSASSGWANQDLNSFDKTDNLTIASDAANQYCYLGTEYAPTTPGRQYRLYFDVSAYSGTSWTIKDYAPSQTIGTVSAAGVRQYIDFRAETPGGFRIIANDTTSSATFDNFSLIDITNGFWSDDEITDWIKEGCRVFSSKSLLVDTLNTIDPMILTTPYYDTTDETFLGVILKINAVIYNIGSTYKGLIKIHPRQIGNLAKSAATGPPKYYCFFSRRLYIYPLASATEVSSGTLDILYSYQTDDITILQDEFQHLPMQYAIAKAFEKDNRMSDAVVLLNQFYKEIEFERQDKYQPESDTLSDFKIGSGRETSAR